VKVNRSHKIRLVPTYKQEIELKKACGVARYTYNWALNEWNKQYKAGTKPSALALKKLWNSCKPVWVYESPKDANQQPFTNLARSFKSFFKGTSKYPKFKKKNHSQSFYMSNDKAKIIGRKFQMTRHTKIKLRENLRFDGKILSYTISRECGQWHVAVAVETEVVKNTSNSKVGIDLGVKVLATCSDGKTYSRSKSTEKNASKLAKLNRELARKVYKSKNWYKQKLKVQKLQLRIKNQRVDNLHKATTEITKNHGIICLEDLDVSSMIKKDKPSKFKSKSLLKGIIDASFRQFRTMIEYKASKVLFVDRYYPSSKTCSSCNFIKQTLRLSDRIFNCPKCGMHLDRDLNASFNILKVAGVVI